MRFQPAMLPPSASISWSTEAKLPCRRTRRVTVANYNSTWLSQRCGIAGTLLISEMPTARRLNRGSPSWPTLLGSGDGRTLRKRRLRTLLAQGRSLSMRRSKSRIGCPSGSRCRSLIPSVSGRDCKARSVGIGAELEGYDPVRLQPVLLPDAMDTGAPQPDLFGQAPGTPMGRRRGLGKVALNTARSLAALMVRGRPERGRLRNPANPASRQRRRHRQTVPSVTSRRSANSRMLCPSALSTIRARVTSACGVLLLRNHASS